MVIDRAASGAGSSEGVGRRLRARCARCGFDVVRGGERFMVHDSVWAATGLAFDAGRLCVCCVERSIGRRLAPDDFTDCEMNFPERGPDVGVRPAVSPAAESDRGGMSEPRWPSLRAEGHRPQPDYRTWALLRSFHGRDGSAG